MDYLRPLWLVWETKRQAARRLQITLSDYDPGLLVQLACSGTDRLLAWLDLAAHTTILTLTESDLLEP